MTLTCMAAAPNRGAISAVHHGISWILVQYVIIQGPPSMVRRHFSEDFCVWGSGTFKVDDENGGLYAPHQGYGP